MACWIGLGLALLFLLWLALQFKTSRPDGTHLPHIHKYRTMMQYIMPTRTESLVYYDLEIRAETLLDYLAQVKPHFHADVSHCLVAAVGTALRENPEMNRFTVGRRLYQRHGNWVTFSMKRKKKSKKAKLATVKKEIPPAITFRQLCELMGGEIQVQRSQKKTYHDKEYDLLTSLPRPILSFGVRLLRWLDYNNILPHSFIQNDPLYTSIFMANLGSIDMRACYHHLYEWGNCPLFLMVGKIEDRLVIEDGKPVVRKILPMCLTYDERIDDGLTASYGIADVQRILEDPFAHLGCLQPDGSDHHIMGQPDNLVPLNAPSTTEETTPSTGQESKPSPDEKSTPSTGEESKPSTEEKGSASSTKQETTSSSLSTKKED